MHAAAHGILKCDNSGEGLGPSRIYRFTSEAAIAASAVRTDEHGQPVQSFVKGILRAGVTLDDTQGRPLAITEQYLDAIVATFGKMQADGVNVPVQSEHTFSPDLTRGRVTRVWREGAMLKASVDLIGEDAIKLASRTDVSVLVFPSWKVGGTVYSDALVHLAATPNPKCTGLGPWAAIAASLAGTAQVFGTPESKGDTMKWQDMAAILGLALTGLDDTTGPAKVTETMQGVVAERAALAASVKAHTDQVGVLQASVTRLTAVAANGAPQIPGEILDEHASITEAKLGGLVEKRIITPDQKTKFAALFCGAKDARPALCLSAAAGKHAGLTGALAASVIDILSTGAAAAMGAKTGAQPKGATDDTPGAPGADFAAMVDSYMPGGGVAKQ